MKSDQRFVSSRAKRQCGPAVAAALLGIGLLAAPAWAQIGSLDTSFDTDGKVTTNFGTVTATANARAVGVQKWPDGTLKRIVVGGASANGSAKQFVLEAFLPNGTLDGSFGNGGIVYQAMGGTTDQINAISIQPDGKIVAAGFSNKAVAEEFAILRLTADGQVDTTFGGGDGIVLEYVAPSASVPGDPITGSTNRGMGVATYTNAGGQIRIVVVGFGRDSAATPTPRYNVVVAKFQDNGSLDTTFANQGRLVDDATGTAGQSRGWNVAVDSSRRILVSGDHNTSTSPGPPASQADFLVVRYNENGTRDTSFSGDGKVVLNPGGQDLARAINVKDLNGNAGEEIVVAGDSDTRYASYMLKNDGTLDTSYNGTGGRIDSVSSGQDIPERVLFTPTSPVKIVLAGMGENGNLSGDFMFAAERLNLDGTLDTSFASGGVLNHNITAGTDWGQDAELQPDGKLIIVGDTNASSTNYVKVARYTTSGVLDTATFNAPTGYYDVTTIVGGTGDVGNAFALDVNGKLLVAGSTSLAGGTDFAIARYLNTGALDTSFSGNGLQQVSMGGYDTAWAVIGTPDGGAILAGDDPSQWALLRLDVSGNPVAAFDGDGKRYDTFGSNGGRPLAMAFDGNGKLLVAGYWLSPTGSSANMAVARYDATTGALDNTFGTGGHVSFNISGFTEGHGLALQPDGKIVLFGHATSGNETYFAVARLLANGNFDTTFNGTGKLTTIINAPVSDPMNPYPHTSEARGGFIQQDGKIVAAGKVVRDLGGGQTFNTFATVRYNPDGSLDASWGTGGVKLDSFESDTIDEINAIFPQHDEKMLAIGTSQKFLIGTSDFAVMRYNWDDGSLDSVFSGDGKQTTPIGPVQDFAYGGYVYPATEANAALRGRFYLGGVDYSVGDFALARFQGDGAPVNGPAAVPDMEAASDSGRFNNDDVTNDRTPTFDVTGCVTGQTLALFVNGAVRNPKARYLCRETSSANSYPLTFPALPLAGQPGQGPLADGSYSFSAYAMTGAGSTAAGPTLSGARIDTVVGVPVLSAPADNTILDAASPVVISGSGSEVGANANSNADVQIADTVSGSDVSVACAESVNDPGNPARPQVLLGTNAGTWSCTAQGLALGKHIVKVRQVDVAWNTSGYTAVRTFYRKANTTTVITSNANPSVYGQQVTFTATVASSVQTPDGVVEFYLDGAVTPTTTVALDGQGKAVYSPAFALLPVGAHTLTAKFLENDRFKPSQHSGFAQTVNKADTTTSITVSPEPSVVGQQVTISFTIAAVAPGAGTPTGTVTVTDGTQQCQATVAAGSCTITYTSAGVRNLTASYPGDANFKSSATAAPTAHTVDKANTTTTITGDTPDPSVVGEAVTVSFSVAAVAPGAGTRTGNVTVSDGVESCTGAINAAGTGSCTVALTTMGLRTLTATYNGDANFNASPASAGAPHTVNRMNTTVAITADLPDPSVVGQAVPVSYSVTVTPPGTGTPTGTVTVTDGVSSCTGTLPATSCSITFTAAGARTLTATYNGDAMFNASPASPGEPHTVSKANTTAAITADPTDPSVTGQSVTISYSVTVTAPGAGTPTGTVTVTDGAGATCTGTLPALSCNITFATIGAKSLTATYNGDASFNASPASTVEPHTVGKASTTTAITADPTDPSAVGQPAAIGYSVTVTAPGSGVPTGNVTVTDGTDSCTGTVAAGTCSIVFTSPGSKTLTATYQGDGNYSASPASASEPHTVIAAATTTVITADPTDPSVVGQPIVVSYSVTPAGAGTPTGSVTVTDGINSCTATVAAGQCTLTLFTAGSRPLTATYSGETNFAGSTSTPEPHTVAKANTTATITADPIDPSVVGQAVTIGYSVSVVAPGSGTPTGSVIVTDGTSSCTGTVAAGSCAITWATPGAKTVTATYQGDASYNASPASPSEPHLVNKADTTTTITANTPNPSATGQAVTVAYAVAVVAPGSGTPTGNVTVTDGVSSCTGTVAAGTCAITFTSAGERTLTATYAGDASYNTSSSAAVPQTVASLGSCASPVILVPDGRGTGSAIPSGATTWFAANLTAGHAYSLELASESGAVAPGTPTVFSGDDGCGAASSVVVRDTTAIEPGAAPGAVRLSFVAAGTNPFFHIQVAGGAGVHYSASLAETTMFSPAFSTNGTFDTQYLILNSTSATLNGTLTFLDSAGALVSAFPFSVAAGQTLSTNSVAIGLARNKTGTVTLVHDGPPGALTAIAAITNFHSTPAYVQPVKFIAVRERK